MKQVEVGKLWLSEELIELVYSHKRKKLDFMKMRDSYVYEYLRDKDFGYWLGEFLDQKIYERRYSNDRIKG